MSALERRVARWPEVIGDLLLQHLTEFPAGDRRRHRRRLRHRSWPGTGWTATLRLRAPRTASRLAGTRRPGLLGAGGPGLPPADPLVRPHRAARRRCRSAGSPGRSRRSPASRPFGRAWARPGWSSSSHPLCADPRAPPRLRARPSQEDYSDEDLEVARRLQPLLMLLERQVRCWARTAAPATRTCLLTGRERAVLVLLERGRTAEAIAHELGISPAPCTSTWRTSTGSRRQDRLRAVVVAREARLLTDPCVDVPRQRPRRILGTMPTRSLRSALVRARAGTRVGCV